MADETELWVAIAAAAKTNDLTLLRAVAVSFPPGTSQLAVYIANLIPTIDDTSGRLLKGRGQYHVDQFARMVAGKRPAMTPVCKELDYRTIGMYNAVHNLEAAPRCTRPHLTGPPTCWTAMCTAMLWSRDPRMSPERMFLLSHASHFSQMTQGVHNMPPEKIAMRNRIAELSMLDGRSMQTLSLLEKFGAHGPELFTAAYVETVLKIIGPDGEEVDYTAPEPASCQPIIESQTRKIFSAGTPEIERLGAGLPESIYEAILSCDSRTQVVVVYRNPASVARAKGGMASAFVLDRRMTTLRPAAP